MASIEHTAYRPRPTGPNTTAFLLECLSCAQLREQITASTNKVEAYHRFAKWLFFGGEGLRPSRGLQDIGAARGIGDSAARGINNRGQAFGSSFTDFVSFLPRYHGFVWQSEFGMKDLGTLPGADDSSAAAINSMGQIVGSSTLPNDIRSTVIRSTDPITSGRIGTLCN